MVSEGEFRTSYPSSGGVEIDSFCRRRSEDGKERGDERRRARKGCRETGGISVSSDCMEMVEIVQGTSPVLTEERTGVRKERTSGTSRRKRVASLSFRPVPV